MFRIINFMMVIKVYKKIKKAEIKKDSFRAAFIKI